MTPIRRHAARAVDRARAAVHHAGFDVTRETFRTGVVAQLHRAGITAVLDVGANTGQFAQDLRRAGYAGRIVSVEPLAAAHTELTAAAAPDPLWTTERVAVSAEAGELTMHVSANSVSSSVLPMAGLHVQAAPESQYVTVEQVPATTVDALVSSHELVPEQTMLKIDVQGFESHVLDGAANTLSRFGAVRTEMSLAPLYEGQVLMPALLGRLDAAGFDLWFIERGFVQPQTRRLLQVDATLFRRAAWVPSVG